MIISHKSPSAPLRVNAERDAVLTAGFIWAPKQATFDTDTTSISLITGRVAKIQAMQALGQIHPDFIWRDRDNRDHLFTPTEFLQFAIDLDTWVEQQYLDSWQKKAQL